MKKQTTCILFLIFTPLLIMAIFYFWGFRINTTSSIPIGIYRVITADNLKGNYIIFCPDNREAFTIAYNRGYIGSGYCPNNSGYLMKKVVATRGDIISSTKDGIYINNKALPFSKPKQQDGLMRTLPQWRVSDYRLKNDEVLAMSNQNEWSFDGRYFGLIQQSQIKGMVIPVWVQHGEKNEN